MTWLSLIGSAIGGLGWSEEQFWLSDPATLSAAMSHKSESEEALQRAEWERTRWMVSVLMAPHNKGRALHPQKLITFPWEAQAAKPTLDDLPMITAILGSRIKHKTDV